MAKHTTPPTATPADGSSALSPAEELLALRAENARLRNAAGVKPKSPRADDLPRVQPNRLGTLKSDGVTENTGYTTVFAGGGAGCISAKKAYWRKLVALLSGDRPTAFALELLAKLEAHEHELV